jgi:mRNA-degrading endonuclease toxin of MazEF toxin-antitoxin module
MNQETEILIGEVWFAKFPLEENSTKYLDRPVIVLNVEPIEVLSVKITKSKPRVNDVYDTILVYWQHANLRMQCTARISKTIYLPKSMFRRKIGVLHPSDFEEIKQMFMKYISSQE